MKYLLIIIALLIQIQVYCQSQKETSIVTAVIQKQIQEEVERQVIQLKQELQKKHETATTEFIIDTFRIEKYMKLYKGYDGTSQGIESARYEGAHQYDSLANKYYKKLSLRLIKQDKRILARSQKAWISYRDNEINLVKAIGKYDYGEDEYHGNGRILRISNATQYLKGNRDRATKLFWLYRRAMRQ